MFEQIEFIFVLRCSRKQAVDVDHGVLHEPGESFVAVAKELAESVSKLKYLIQYGLPWLAITLVLREIPAGGVGDRDWDATPVALVICCQVA